MITWFIIYTIGRNNLDIMAAKTSAKYLYYTTIFGGDNYVPGAIALAYSLILTKTPYDIACAVTPDVSKKARKQLKAIFTHVISIPYIRIKVKQLETKKQEQIYETWKDVSFTKFNCMNPKIYSKKYKKVLFLDADLLIMRNIDHLFDLPTPVGAFVNLWAEGGGRKKSKYKNYYKDIPNFGEVKWRTISKALKDGFVINGHIFMISPSLKDFSEFIKMVKAMEPFKIGNNLSMYDEQAISHFETIKKRNWIKLDHTYNYILWHIAKINKILGGGKLQKPYIVHFMNKEKPWTTERSEWPDIPMWWQVIDLLLSDKRFSKSKHATLASVFDKKLLAGIDPPGCPYCNIIEKELSPKFRGKSIALGHKFIAKGRINCKRIADVKTKRVPKKRQ